MRIMLLIGEMATGGAERVAATLANAWTARGSYVWLVPTYLASRTVEHELRSAVKLVFLADQPGVPPHRGRFAIFRKARALRNLVENLQPDLVVSFLTNVNVLALIALTGSPTPLVVSERTDPAADVELHWTLKLLRGLLYQFADGFVVQTATAAQLYRRRMLRPPTITVIPNHLPEALAREPARASHPKRGGTIVAMGRLTESKGFDILIRTFARHFADWPEWHLDIWGDGPLREQLAALIDHHGVAGRVRLKGRTTRPWSELVRAQIFALPSAYEGFPNVMLEAMAVGLPCVAFDCPSGPAAMSADGTAAVIVPLGDENAFGQELWRLAADPQARSDLGQRAAEHVRVDYSEFSILSQWDAVLVAAAGGRLAALNRNY